jgi:hypothetical protein
MQRKPTTDGVTPLHVDAADVDEVLPEELTSIGIDAGARLTPQQRAAARRELERLLDKLVTDIKHLTPTVPASAELPEGALTPYRSPDRCVVQGAEGAVSVSWFPAQFTDSTLGELQVIEWRGVVSVRGAVRRREPAVAASIVHADVYHQVQTSSGWGWQPVEGALVFSTDDLALHCLDRVRPKIRD